jgi:hypothetical protein
MSFGAPPWITTTKSTVLARHLSDFFFEARDQLDQLAEQLAFEWKGHDGKDIQAPVTGA